MESMSNVKIIIKTEGKIFVSDKVNIIGASIAEAFLEEYHQESLSFLHPKTSECKDI